MTRSRLLYTVSAQIRGVITFLMGFFLGSGDVGLAIVSFGVYSALDLADSVLYWRAIDERPVDKIAP